MAYFCLSVHLPKRYGDANFSHRDHDGGQFGNMPALNSLHIAQSDVLL